MSSIVTSKSGLIVVISDPAVVARPVARPSQPTL